MSGLGAVSGGFEKNQHQQNAKKQKTTLSTKLPQQNHNPHPSSEFSFSAASVSPACIHKEAPGRRDREGEAPGAPCSVGHPAAHWGTGASPAWLGQQRWQRLPPRPSADVLLGHLAFWREPASSAASGRNCSL